MGDVLKNPSWIRKVIAMKVTTHKDIDIYLEGERFKATVLEEERFAYSMPELKEKIDQVLREDAATNRERVAIACIDVNGDRFTITGVHAGNGNLLISPKVSVYGIPELFADTDNTRVLAGKILAKIKEVEELRALIDPYRIGLNNLGSDHPTRIHTLKSRYDLALEGKTPPKTKLSI
jgi:hypothetical protein